MKGKKRPAVVRKPRTTAKAVGGGNPSYSGYEYQIEVTIWVGLDLMIANGVPDVLVIEPRSHEDIDAVIRNHNEAVVETTGAGTHYDLVLQAKSQSTNTWSAKAISNVRKWYRSQCRSSKLRCGFYREIALLHHRRMLSARAGFRRALRVLVCWAVHCEKEVLCLPGRAFSFASWL